MPKISAKELKQRADNYKKERKENGGIGRTPTNETAEFK